MPEMGNRTEDRPGQFGLGALLVGIALLAAVLAFPSILGIALALLMWSGLFGIVAALVSARTVRDFLVRFVISVLIVVAVALMVLPVLYGVVE
jgi:hypothetical protein